MQDRLAGTVMAEDGTPVPGPNVGSWSGRRHGRRQDRHWATSWSPQQIAHRLRIEYPDDESMRVSHEAIYQALYIQGRGGLRRELTACLRTGRALRAPRARRRGRGKEFVGPDIMISERPAEAEDRAVPGHWEGDLIIGLGSSAIGTLVERTTRFTMLLHLPRMAERGRLRVKNGLALAGHGAEAVRDAITSMITALPDQLRRSLTWDQGAEMAQHAQLRIDTGLHVFFCDPPAVRGSAARTRTPTACCASTSPKGLTSIGTVLATSLLSRPHSTADRGRLSVGNPHPKPSTNCYSHTSEDVLRRPLEPGQISRCGTRIASWTPASRRRSAAKAMPMNNALAESVIGVYKTEVIRRKGPWRTLEAVEFATLTWVDWFNTQRLLGPLGDIPPAEFEAQYYEQAAVA